MAEGGLPDHIPRLNFWDVLGFDWPVNVIRPSKDVIRDKVRVAFTKAQETGALTGRVAWEILESEKVFLDSTLQWPTILNYGFRYCDPRLISRSRPPCSSYSSTAAFARSELSRPQYKSQGRSSGPELRGLNWDRATSFADLIIPSALPSICIGELSMNGRLVFAFVDSRNELLCAPAEVDEWGSPCLRSYNVGSKASVCIKPPFTTLSDTAIREYISAYANWIMRYSSPPASSSNESTPEFGIITPHTEDGQSPTNRFGSIFK